MNEEIHYLYLITREDGETYIGVSKHPDRRKMEHYSSANGCKDLRHRNFTMKLLCAGEKEYIYNLERLTIKEFEPSLNKAPGGSFAFNHIKGEEHPFAILNDDVVLEIKNILVADRNFSIQKLADKYGVSRTCIAHIANNKTWKHLGPIIPPKTGIATNEKFIEKVKDMWLNQRLTNKQIANMTGRSYATIIKITARFNKSRVGILGKGES